MNLHASVELTLGEFSFENAQIVEIAVDIPFDNQIANFGVRIENEESVLIREANELLDGTFTEVYRYHN